MWFYWNLKWPPQIDFLNICDRKKSNLIYGGGWYRTSVLLLLQKHIPTYSVPNVNMFSDLRNIKKNEK